MNRFTVIMWRGDSCTMRHTVTARLAYHTARRAIRNGADYAEFGYGRGCAPHLYWET